MNKMVSQAMTAVVCTLCIQIAFAVQEGPDESDEIHSIDYVPREGRDVRGEMFGMTADEKAGLTVGFVVAMFFLFVLAGFIGNLYGKIVTLEAHVEALQSEQDAEVEILKHVIV